MGTSNRRHHHLISALTLAAWAFAAGTSFARAAAPAAPSAGRLAFLQDEYGRALAEARAKKSPLFIDFWAPW